MYKLLLIPLILPLFLFGCSPSTNLAKKIDPQKTYFGYPCFDTCADFRTGYDQAVAQKITSRSVCQTFPVKEQLGCQAYVNDLETDTIDNGGLRLE